jgi:hypothetical protein
MVLHEPPRCRHWIAQVFILSLALSRFAYPESLPPIVANQNHTPAGSLRGGVLSLRLEIAKGEWHPEGEDGMALAVYAFGESGRALQNPGPLIRVPQGTEIRASLHNSLPVPITIHGLGEPRSDAAVRVAPGATQQVTFKPTTAPHGGNLMDEGMGVSGGAVEQVFGSHPTSALLIQRLYCCTVYRFPPAARSLGRHQISVVRCIDSPAARGAAIASLFDRCSLTLRKFT